MRVNMESEVSDIAVLDGSLLVLDKDFGHVIKHRNFTSSIEREYHTGIPNASNLGVANGSFNIITEWNAFCEFNADNGEMVNDVPIDLPDGTVTGIAPAGPVR